MPNGTYQVKLYFAENEPDFSTTVGQRVFSVQLEGTTVFSNLDVYAQAGYRTALVKSATTTISDGQLNLTIVHGVDWAFVDAIEIIGQSTDTVAPSIPASLTATAASNTQINLSWTASTDNVGVTGYRVERCQGVSCTTFAQIGTPTTTTYSSTGLTASTAYNYRVRATDAEGNLSGYSVTAGATTQSAPDITAPTAPTALTATATSATQINLGWTASTDAVGVTGYRIERCTGASCTNYAQIATSTTTSYSNTALTANTTYRYRVRANDAANNLSGYSSVITAPTPVADTQAPTAPTAFAATVASSTQINLSWTASTDNVGVTGYRVERCQGVSCTTFVQIATPTATIYSDTGLTASTSYRYRVRANDAVGNLSAYANVITASTTGTADTQAPTVPGGLSATAASSTQINLVWTASSDNVSVTAYLLERCQGVGCGTFTQIASVTGTTYSNTGLTVATNYSYRIRAKDAANNNSSYSTIATAATQYAGPITYTYSYDALGRVKHAAGSNGTSIDYSYDANGNVTLINRQ